MSNLTTLRLGGPASVIDATTEDDLIEIAREAKSAERDLQVIAGGSNIVVADDGLPGLVLRVATQGIQETRGSDSKVRLDVAAGHDWDSFVISCVDQGYAGIEALSGIPGTVGATPIQNVGASRSPSQR